MKTKTYTLFVFFIALIISVNTILQNAISQERKKTPIPGLFNTGVDNNRLPLEDGEVDPHYILAISPDNTFPGPDAKVVFSDGFPIGAWIENDLKSKWIAPRADAGEFNTFGMYAYSLSFSLYGFKPETAEVRGFWTSDNNGLDILINESRTGFATDYNAFAVGYFPFEIKQGFTHGVNTITFVVYNGEAPTGLRVVIYGEAEPLDAVFNDTDK